MVEVSFSPAPSSGTTMSFARNCGSLTTSCGSRTAPKVTWAPLKTSFQCEIGCERKISCRIAESRIREDSLTTHCFQNRWDLVRSNYENEPGAIGGAIYVQTCICGMRSIVQPIEIRAA